MSISSKKQLSMPVLLILGVVLIVLLGYLVNQINPITLSMALSMLLGVVLVMAVATFAYFRDAKRLRTQPSAPDDQGEQGELDE